MQRVGCEEREKKSVCVLNVAIKWVNGVILNTRYT